MRMHPGIRILIVMVSAVAVANGDVRALLGGVILSLALHVAAGLSMRDGLLTMILRMRWFFLSIMLLYAWFTPGTALLPALSAYSPSQQGVAQGLTRCLVLIVLLSLVHWLVRSTKRDQLIQGIYWLAKPLVWWGLKPDVIAVRLDLVLETVPVMERGLATQVTAFDARDTPVRRMARRAQAALDDALNQADRAALIEIDVDPGGRPAPRDWVVLTTVVLVSCIVLASAGS
jgi:energy-coupling factor transporter transmembrane protein EcfT